MNATTSTQFPAWLPADARSRRILALGLVALIVSLVAAAVVVPAVLLHRHYDSNVLRLSRQLESQTAFNASRPRMQRALDVLRARDNKKLYLKGTTAALAAAEMQDQVKAVIESNGGRMQGVDGIAHKDDAPYRTVGATFRVSVNNPNLRRLLHALETQEPYILVDNLTVRSHTPPGFRPPPGTPEPDLYAQFDASAVAHIATDAAAPTPATVAKPEGAKS